MKPTQIEDSKTIAEFMGEKKIHEKEGRVWVLENPVRHQQDVHHYTKYHTSWDWLMPVWVKFSDLQLEDNSIFMAHRYSISQIILFMTTEEAFTALANAIKWYNSTKS